MKSKRFRWLLLFFLLSGLVLNRTSFSQQPAIPSQAPITLDQAIGLLKATISARTTSLSFKIPEEQVNWGLTFYRLNKDAFFLTYQPEGYPRFQLQAWLCEMGDKDIWSDVTLLGAEETPETFYKSNESFYSIVKSPADLALCLQEGMTLSTYGGERPLYKSDDRLLKHLCNWLSFLTFKEKDSKRAKGFLRLITEQQRSVLLQADAEGDFDRVKDRIKLFDQLFPFQVLEPMLPGDEDIRASLRTCLETTLSFRRKLKVHAPEIGQNIGRDETLLQKVSALSTGS